MLCTRVGGALCSWREESSVRIPGWGPAHKAVQDLCLARRRGAGSGGIARRWSKLGTSLKSKVLEQLIDKEELDIALTVYDRASSVRNTRIEGRIAALLAESRGADEAEAFVAGLDEELGDGERIKLRCSMLEFYARHGLWDRAREECAKLEGFGKAAVHAGRRSLFQAQAKFGDPFEAEKTLESIKALGGRIPSRSYKSLLFAFGKAALYAKVDEVLEEMIDGGHKLDAATFNMMLTSYGTHRKYREMREVLETMEESRIGLTVLSWNAISNACPMLTLLAHDLDADPARGVAELLRRLEESEQELELVSKLLEMNLPLGAVEWSPERWKLDMHSMTVGTAYLALVCWIDEARRKFVSVAVVPKEIEVVTGWGKHSRVEGTSDVKNAVLGCMRSAKGPFRVDRDNRGRLLGRGHRFKEWLLSSQIIHG